MAEDWRLEHLRRQPLLKGVRLQRKAYRQYSPEWDHDHCAACWTKFAVIEGDGGDGPILREGFTTCSDYKQGAEYEWICPECYFLFKDEMSWSEVRRDE